MFKVDSYSRLLSLANVILNRFTWFLF